MEREVTEDGFALLGSDEGTLVIWGEGLRGPDAVVEGLFCFTDETRQLHQAWIETADQWGPFRVRAESHQRRPAVPAGFADVVGVSLSADGPLVVDELIDSAPVRLTSGGGVFRVRISARGRARGSAEPETYLVQAWPEEIAGPLEVVAGRVEPAPAPAPASEPDAEWELVSGLGLAASGRIGRDADRAPGHRELSGEVGTVRLTVRLGVKPSKVVDTFQFGPTVSRHIPSWDSMAGPDVDEIGAELRHAASQGHPDQLSGHEGIIRTVNVVVERARRLEQRWAWLVPATPGVRPGPRIQIPDDDAVLTILVPETSQAGGASSAVIVLEHRGIPVEWVDDLTAWWDYQLKFVERLSRQD